MRNSLTPEDIERMIEQREVILLSRTRAAIALWGKARAYRRLVFSEGVILLPLFALLFPMVAHRAWAIGVWILIAAPFWGTAQGRATAVGCLGVLVAAASTLTVAMALQQSTWHLAGPLVLAWVWLVGHAVRGMLIMEIRSALNDDDLRMRLVDAKAVEFRERDRQPPDAER